MARPVLALDVGGTKLAVGLVDQSGTVLAAERVPTPVTDDAEQVWAAAAALLRRVLGSRDATKLAGVGIGCGGPMRWPAGVVSPLNIPAWREFPLLERVAALLPGPPVRIHNDAICLTVAEHWRGAAAGHRAVLGMVVSTGVGGGLVLDGRLYDGPTGNAGHIGHVVVEPDGPACSCGGRGCLEAVASGPALARWARAHGWSPPEGEGATAQVLAVAAGGGDPVATAAFRRVGLALGRAIASIAAVCEIEVAVLGGGVVQSGSLLFDPLRAALRAHAGLGYLTGLRVEPAGLGQNAGLVGAAALIARGERYWQPPVVDADRPPRSERSAS